MKLNKGLLYAGIIILLCFVSYFNIISNQFVWDDTEFIVNRIETKSFAGTISALGTDEYGIYRPVRTIFYYFAYKLFGLNPILYHLFAIIMHSIVSILLFFIIKKLFSQKLAFLSAALFAVSPIHVGRVANATASFDIIGLVFYLIAFYLYILFRERNSKKLLVYSLFIFIIGLFASEECFTFPFMILLYELVFGKDGLKRYYKSSSYFITIGIFLLFRFFVIKVVSRVSEYPGGSFLATMLTMPKILFKYVILTIIPIGLTPFRKIEFIYSWLDLWFIIPILGIIAFALFAYSYRKNKTVIFFSGWFLITMIPFLNIAPLQKIMAERYFYLASLSVFVLIAYIFMIIEKMWASKLPYVLFGIIVILFIGMTFYNNAFWKDEFTLMNRGISLNPFDSKAHNNLGTHYFNNGDYGSALLHYKAAVNNQPDNYKAWTNLGVLYSVMKDYDSSIESLNKALEITPYDYEAYDKLGITYMHLDENEKAMKAFGSALYFEENYYPALAHLGVLYGRVGQIDKAIAYLKKAISVNPYYAEAYQNLGLIYNATGSTAEAQKYFVMAKQLDPKRYG